MCRTPSNLPNPVTTLGVPGIRLPQAAVNVIGMPNAPPNVPMRIVRAAQSQSPGRRSVRAQTNLNMQAAATAATAATAAEAEQNRVLGLESSILGQLGRNVLDTTILGQNRRNNQTTSAYSGNTLGGG